METRTKISTRMQKEQLAQYKDRDGAKWESKTLESRSKVTSGTFSFHRPHIGETGANGDWM